MSEEEDLYWVIKVQCRECGWNGYSDQCVKGGGGLALLCPKCSVPISPVWRSKE